MAAHMVLFFDPLVFPSPLYFFFPPPTLVFCLPVLGRFSFGPLFPDWFSAGFTNLGITARVLTRLGGAVGMAPTVVIVNWMVQYSPNRKV